jgi:hypothetical protein
MTVDSQPIFMTFTLALQIVCKKNSYTNLVTDTTHREMDEHDLNIRCSVLTSHRMPYNLHEHVRDTVRCLNMLILTLSTVRVPIPHPTACHFFVPV